MIAQQDGSQATQKKLIENSATAGQAPPAITPERRAELMKFVRANHVELERLINSLRKQRPAEYEAALKYLDKSVANLASYKKTVSEERYNQLLEDWKLKSRIQVMSAQLSISDTPERRDQLQRLITRQLDNRYSQLKLDAERTRSRLDKLEEAIAALEDNRTEEIQRQMDNAIKASQRINAARAKESKKEKETATDKNDPLIPVRPDTRKAADSKKNDNTGE